MAEPGDLDDVPQAAVVPPKRGRISIIWIIPILAALVAVGIAIQRIRSEGPTITIVFTAAEGVEAGKTLIKYKDVSIGRVTAVSLTTDYSKVEVTAKITKRAAGLMVQDAKFWVVRPSISLTGISGLSTLLSGNYIGFEPGELETTEERFTGLDVAPFVTEKEGRLFVLKASDLGSLEVGSPIYYRRLPVGQIVEYDLTSDGTAVQMTVFVRAPYDKYVFPGTRFWNASGVEVSAGADGVNVRTESVVALLVGGISFDTPPFEPKVQPAAANAAFTLYNDRTVAMKAPDPVARHFVLFFKESLRGLTVGAPVTFLGLPAGEVTAVDIVLDATRTTVRSRVQVTFYPERLISLAATKTEMAKATEFMLDERKRRDFWRREVEQRGLRGQLRTGSLLTGQLYVSFDYYPTAPKAKVDFAQAEPELPVVPGTLANLEDKLAGIFDKIDKMPLEAIGNSLKKDLDNLDNALTDARKLITNVDAQLVPGLKTAIDDLRGTLVAVERAATNANANLLESNAATQEDLRNALYEFARAARSLRVLTDALERQPSSLIRGKTDPSGGK